MKSRSKMTKVFVWSLVPIALVLMLLPQLVGAQGATVNIADGDVAGLIAAINTANTNPGADTINLAPGGTYTLTAVDNPSTGLPIVTSQITINGSGATIQRSSAAGTPDFRIIQVTGPNAGDLTLNGVTIGGGNLVSNPGGGIYNNGGTLKLIDVLLTGNGADGGAGIYNVNGAVELVKSSVSANIDRFFGAGIWNHGSDAILRLTNSSITGNTGRLRGTGIYNLVGTATLINSTVSGNIHGAGIMNHLAGSKLTLINSTVSGNGGTAANDFGGILIDAGTAELVNTTVSGNTGTTGEAGIQNGSGTISLKNTIVANNSPVDCVGVITTLGHNIVSDASCGLAGTGDLNSTNPLLGTLANNGGPTQTHALLLGSAAIDAVPLADCTDANGVPIAADQRGVARPQGAACDIGAYEVGATTCLQPPSGMVSWWPGDGSANDIQGSNNGTLVNGATFAPGKVGQALSLDGADDYVQLSNSQYNPFPATGFTYDFWINPFDTPSGRSRTIISNHHAAGNWWNGISLFNGSVEFVLQNAATGQTFRWQTSSTLTPNAWQLIAVAYQNQGDQATDAVIYFNGTAQALDTFSIGPAYSTGFTPGYSAADPLGFALGRLLEDTPSAYFRGLIDEGEFFNRALQPPEIQGIFNAGSAGKCKCVPPPPNMVAWWPGDGNANDIVGGNNGTLVGATIDPAGMVDQALSFDGVNDFVAVPNSASLNPGGSFSIDAWVYPRSNGFQTIVGKWGDTGDQPDQRSYVLVNTETGALNFGISDAAHQLDSAFHTLRTPDGALTLNAWNHVAVVYDQSTGTRKILVNGSQQATRTDPPITVLNSVARFGIGADLTSSTTSTALFDGLIDEVEFFNRALSASEVQAIYNAGSAGKCKCVPPPSGMVGWWPGDNHSNDIRNTNHGTLVGGVSYAPGKVNQAFSFPSLSSTGSDRVSLTSAPSANTFTIEAWVFANQHGPSAYRTIYADDFRGFWLESGKLNWWQGGDRFVGNTTVALGGWHHIALTYSQGTFTGYLNGAANGTSFFPGESLPTGTGLGIGGHSGFLPEDFDGLIDELGVYDRALDPAEILAIYNAGSAGKCFPQTCAPTIICPENIVVDNSNHPGQCSAVVNYTVSASASCSSVTVGCSPSSGSVFSKGTTTVNCAATNSNGTAACSFTVTVIPPQLTALSPARVWIGLKNSDDVGTKFDLLAEVLKNGAVVGTGQLNDVPGGGSGFNNAVLRTITLGLAGLPVDICIGDSLGFRLSVRVAATSGHSSGTARLWYNGKFIDTGASRDAGSRFNATIGGGTADYFLRTAVLNTTPGSSKTFIDVLVNRNVGGNPFKPFGTWSITF